MGRLYITMTKLGQTVGRKKGHPGLIQRPEVVDCEIMTPKVTMDSKDFNQVDFQTLFSGTRLVISALISENGFHVPTIDIFKCDQDHSMDGSHFVDWISRTSSLLRQEHGNTEF